MSKISFVYFDVGGVALKDFSDTPKWENMLRDLGLDKFDRSQVDQIYGSHDTAICKGEFRVEGLIPIYKKQFGITVPPDFDFLQYFVDRFELNEGIWPIITQLRNRHLKVGLLTDMYPDMLSRINAKKLIPQISWDAVIDSSIEGVRKPMPEIYKLAQEMAGVPAEEILFIDNRQKNLDGAQRAKWQTYLYDSSDYSKANSELSNFFKLALDK